MLRLLSIRPSLSKLGKVITTHSTSTRYPRPIPIQLHTPKPKSINSSVFVLFEFYFCLAIIFEGLKDDFN